MSEVTISHVDIYHRLGQLEAKLDAFLLRLASHEEELGKLEARVASLERWRGWLLGAGAALGLFASIALDYLRSQG